MFKQTVYAMALTATLSFSAASQAADLDVEKYNALALEVVQGALSGNPNIDDLIAKNKQLVTMGKAACQARATSSPQDAPLMNLVAKNADHMQTLSLEEIEEQWHDGEFVTANGIDLDAYDHYGEAISLMDTVVHPATSVIALDLYKQTGDEALLEQVKDEVTEVMEHIKQL
ncbi:hypothetical protein [Enterovibrio paralichthyis]|uniref:hypothetical protein n=1 Tax=Enterovibrio paralichthyis TaxID=2853805 RepID=UPI001C497985|nr:hypothetical protein [Enterovibrio paralichthyis]MBV7296269.1 hypothetical protein [Enterovibrio paralichthyis]